jgi:hypothetical protein
MDVYEWVGAHRSDCGGIALWEQSVSNSTANSSCTPHCAAVPC